MDYKGFHFWVVQTANPAGWKWTVHFSAKKSRSGLAPDRKTGVLYAKAAIDRATQATRVILDETQLVAESINELSSESARSLIRQLEQKLKR